MRVASFDYCAQVLANVDDANRGSHMFTLANDFFDHYSTEAMYLRMNGLVPPTAQQRSEQAPAAH